MFRRVIARVGALSKGVMGRSVGSAAVPPVAAVPKTPVKFTGRHQLMAAGVGVIVGVVCYANVDNIKGITDPPHIKHLRRRVEIIDSHRRYTNILVRELCDLGRYYYNVKNDLPKAVEYLKIAEYHAKTAGDQIGIYNMIASILLSQKKTFEGLDYAFLAGQRGDVKIAEILKIPIDAFGKTAGERMINFQKLKDAIGRIKMSNYGGAHAEDMEVFRLLQRYNNSLVVDLVMEMVREVNRVNYDMALIKFLDETNRGVVDVIVERLMARGHLISSDILRYYEGKKDATEEDKKLVRKGWLYLARLGASDGIVKAIEIAKGQGDLGGEKRYRREALDFGYGVVGDEKNPGGKPYFKG
ncbi:MAG: hypothetical protein Hyperionvirus15_4 [Hyperionvirus sp.]|uniref:Uncharacterized protein n=1 Tax=Hyperionvirus sp. TaxID=2487770 RepID=A0A3G5A9L3_9VIRU|nr:MAG: hypothetical protein Hyperionvirus15_4 [Hyperionvirus sp.]